MVHFVYRYVATPFIKVFGCFIIEFLAVISFITDVFNLSSSYLLMFRSLSTLT